MYQICSIYFFLFFFSVFPPNSVKVLLRHWHKPLHKDMGGGGSHAWTVFVVLVARCSGKGVVHMCKLYQLIVLAIHRCGKKMISVLVAGKEVVHMCILYQLCLSFTAVEKNVSCMWPSLCSLYLSLVAPGKNYLVVFQKKKKMHFSCEIDRK